MPKPTPALALAPLLRRQFGAFTTAQARAEGVPAWVLTDLRTAGEIETYYRGVHGSTLYPDSWERRWLAALLAAGPGAAISHRAAAHLHGLEYTKTRKRPLLEISVRRRTRVPAVGGRIHTQVPLRDDIVVTQAPWRITSAAWTLCTLAHGLGLTRIEQAIGAAIAKGHTTERDLAACVPRLRCCPGVPLLRIIVDRLSPEIRLTRSDAERLALRLALDAGLPPPEVNLRVVDAAGHVRYLDLAWPEWGVCVEIDVHPEHGRSIGRNRDGRRQNDLVPEWTPLRFDDLDLQFEPTHVVDVIRRTLRAAGAPV